MNNQTSRSLTFQYDDRTKVMGDIKFRLGGGIDVERTQTICLIGGEWLTIQVVPLEYPNRFTKFFYNMALELIAKERAQERPATDFDRDEFCDPGAAI